MPALTVIINDGNNIFRTVVLPNVRPGTTLQDIKELLRIDGAFDTPSQWKCSRAQNNKIKYATSVAETFELTVVDSPMEIHNFDVPLYFHKIDPTPTLAIPAGAPHGPLFLGADSADNALVFNYDATKKPVVALDTCTVLDQVKKKLADRPIAGALLDKAVFIVTPTALREYRHRMLGEDPLLDQTFVENTCVKILKFEGLDNRIEHLWKFFYREVLAGKHLDDVKGATRVSLDNVLTATAASLKLGYGDVRAMLKARLSSLGFPAKLKDFREGNSPLFSPVNTQSDFCILIETAILSVVAKNQITIPVLYTRDFPLYALCVQYEAEIRAWFIKAIGEKARVKVVHDCAQLAEHLH